MSIQSNIDKVEKNVASIMSLGNQKTLVISIKEQIQLKLSACEEYYNSVGGNTYQISSAKQALLETSSQGIYQFYADLHDVKNYNLPFHCNNIFETSIEAIKGKFGNAFYFYDSNECTAPNSLSCSVLGLIDGSFATYDYDL
jgi:hypothetical protein